MFIEKLSEHTKSLHPLNYGDHVMIQNQTGLFLTSREIWSSDGKTTTNLLLVLINQVA